MTNNPDTRTIVQLFTKGMEHEGRTEPRVSGNGARPAGRPGPLRPAPRARRLRRRLRRQHQGQEVAHDRPPGAAGPRSEEHTSELQSLTNLVCRLLLEKKKIKKENTPRT